jgi:biofilm PGA synthesis N-glycosyltransferase PgaC
MSNLTYVPRYVIVTPVRDEEEHLQSTIKSLAGQTIRPAEWVVVNDGSTDKTGEIIDAAAAHYPWIRGVHRTNRGFRKSGGGVVEAFNDGLRELQTTEWDFIVKLDGDLAFEPDYFEKCFEVFEQEPKLGVGGGVICYVDENGGKTFEDNPAFHVRGATKIYRRCVWEAIGGFWPAPGWDTLDEVKANMLGWRTRSFPDLHLVHHRVTGSADGWLGGLVKNGRANYISGYHPLFMIAKCLRRLIVRPYVLGAFALMWGYVSGYFKGIPQVNDPQLIRYLRGQQIDRLWGRETVWK